MAGKGGLCMSIFPAAAGWNEVRFYSLPQISLALQASGVETSSRGRGQHWLWSQILGLYASLMTLGNPTWDFFSNKIG